MSGIINPFSEPEQETTVHSGEKVRLLACKNCKTIEVLDNYEGPPEYDAVLQVSLERHPNHIGNLMDVPKSAWDRTEVRETLQKQIQAGMEGGETGLGAEAYALRDNFREDAMKCWEKHLRTPACSDYKSDAMQLVPNTQAERKAAGMAQFDRHNPATKRHLCEYCPVHSLVQQAQRKKAGMYE